LTNLTRSGSLTTPIVATSKESRTRPFALGLVCAMAAWAALDSATPAYADFTYQVDGFPPPSGNFFGFNNSAGSETEDDFVANSFQVVSGGTRLTSITFLTGFTGDGSPLFNNTSITAAIYTGSSLTDPNAGGGLKLISTTTVSVTDPGLDFITINLAAPVNLAVGQVFYAALLIRGVTGNMFPFVEDTDASDPSGPPLPLGRSFFDVGPTIGGSYNLNNTSNLTVLGGTNPVVGSGIQSAGNLVLRVNSVPSRRASS